MKRIKNQVFIVQCRFQATKFGMVLILFNSLGESSEECMEPVFFCTASNEDTLTFVFRCRGEEWLRAKGIMPPLRQKRGKPGSVESLEVAPLPKPEPMEDVIPANEVQVASTSGSLPQPLSPTPLDYIDGGQEDDSITLGQLQKIPRHSGNFTFTTEGETHHSMVARIHSLH